MKNLLVLIKLNFSQSALFHMKIRACLKNFVNDYSSLPDYLLFILNTIRKTLSNAEFKIKIMDIQQPRVT